MNTSVLSPIVAAIIAAFISSTAHADDISNGSFELPQVPGSSYSNFGTGSNLIISNWTVVGSQVSIVSGTFSSESLKAPAQEGNQWLDLTGERSNKTENGVTQTISTIPGTMYNLWFWVGNIVDPGNIFGKTSTVQVSINGGTKMPFENTDGAGTNTMNWKQFRIPFTATSTSTTIAFFNGDPPEDNSNALDNITIDP